MAGRLAGKVAIVAGAGAVAKGLSNGAATAILFAREGAKVVAADSDLERATETAQLIWNEGGECLPIQADVTSSDDLARLAATANETYGAIDVLFNNVGLQALGGPLEVSIETWERVMRTNVTSMLMAI